MKKLLLAAMVLGFTHFIYAQDESKPDRQTEEITIRNKGDKDINMTVQIIGDSVIVNGKPLSEFIDSQVSIRKRKMVISDGDNEMAFDFDNNNFERQVEALAEQRAAMGMQRENMDKQWKSEEKNFNKEWKNDKEISRPFLGVTTEKADKGVRVVEVVEGSAAEKTGLKEGDIITKVGDKKIDNPEMLSSTVMAMKPKDEIKVYYIRDGKEKNSNAVLGERKEVKNFAYSFKTPNPYSFEMPELPELPEAPEMPEMMMPRQKKLGLKIQDTEEGKVKVIDVEDSSAAAKAGIKKDDIITEIDGEKIDNTDEAREQLHPEPDKNSYKIKINRNGSDMNFEIKIPKKLKTADL
jgi:serine protease Do